MPLVTPTTKNVLLFSPCAFELPPIAEGHIEHYATQNNYAPVGGNKVVVQDAALGLAPTCTVTRLAHELQTGENGLICIHTHGSRTLGLVAEVYAHTGPEPCAGQIKRNQVFQGYVAAYGMQQVDVAEFPDHFHAILVKGAFLQAQSVDKNTIVFSEACYSATYNPFWNCRAVMGFKDKTNAGQAGSDAQIIYGRMSGDRDRIGPERRRRLADAFQGVDQNLELTGDGEVTLAPAVIGYQPKFWIGPGEIPCFVEFNLDMKQVNPASLVEVHGPPGVVVSRPMTWASTRRIEFAIHVPTLNIEVTFRVVANNALSAYNDALLDGNQVPAAPIHGFPLITRTAICPNGDDFVWTTYSRPIFRPILHWP
jgi:hypothetical protein